MPHLVAGLVAGAGVSVAVGAAVRRHVADGAEVHHLAGLAQRDVLGLRFAETAREVEVRLVGHRLLRKAEQRPRVDRLPWIAPTSDSERLDARSTPVTPRPEVRVQGLGVEPAHGHFESSWLIIQRMPNRSVHLPK